MLVLKRNHGESVDVAPLDANGKPICWIRIVVDRGGPVRLGFIADQGAFKIIRTELRDQPERTPDQS